MKRIVAALGLLLALALPAMAQIDRASLTGTVKDSQGALVPGAAVTATHIATNVAARTRSNNPEASSSSTCARGNTWSRRRPPASRRPNSRSSSRLASAARSTSRSASAASARSVTVEEGQRLLNTTQSNLGAVIDQNAVAKLPLAIRNWDDLLALVPGVQGDRFTEQGGGTSFGRTGGINVHGARSLQNNFLLDGVDNNSISDERAGADAPRSRAPRSTPSRSSRS